MQVVISAPSVARISNISDHITLAGYLACDETIRIALKMGIIENQFSVRAELVNRRAATLALKQLDDLTITSGKDWSSRRCGNINRIMHASLGAGLGKRIAQL